MHNPFPVLLLLSILFVQGCIFKPSGNRSDPLPSWNETPTKHSILAFVSSVTDKSSPDYVPPAKRVATFDNDGTLWSEKPVYFQLMFAIDRVKALAPHHPDWKNLQPFKAVLENDMETLAASETKGLLQLIMATHANMTTDEFSQIVKDWLETAKHPELDRPYNELVFQPMLELLAYLRANDFKTFIVSGGGIGFMRPWVEQVYGIPPEQAVGSSIDTKFEIQDEKPVLVRLAKINFINDKAGKPVAIHRYIGRRPIAAFGNSDGDLEMLQWTAAGKAKSIKVLIHHTDELREYAYDKDSPVGKLDKALDAAHQNDWTVVDMKQDWKVIYPSN